MDAKLVVLLTLFAAANAVPLTTQNTDTCSTECTESNNYRYNPGTTYLYDYKVDTDSSIAGAFQDSAKTSLQTTVNIEVLSQCEFSLQLTNTHLSHTDGKGAMKTADRENEFRAEVETSPLRFSFQNGVVDHVCSDKDESVRSLNLKKGILSAFQNSMDDLTQGKNVTETDVVGTCNTEYNTVSNGYYTTEVKKVKDILSCTDRLDYNTIVQLTPYKVPSDLQHLPIMKTTHECDQTIENAGILKTSTCKEIHVYRPFANGESGAQTTVTQTLTYQTYKTGISRRNVNIQSKSSLLFDHSADHLTKEQSRVAVEKKLTEVCDTTNYDVRPETPRLFSELVVLMKGLDKTDLTELHRLLKTKTMCPSNGKAYKFFHDALPMMNTQASVSLMTHLINTKDVTGMEATAWLTSLAFVQNPTSDMLLDVKTLLDNKDVRMDAMLPVSSMVNNFCKKIGTCDQDSAVLSLMSALEGNIDYYCDASGKKFELTLMTLKAIGNAGHARRAIPVLNKCLTSTSNPLEIRVAAAEAFRRMPCTTGETILWETFTDKDIDSELRINAYLALMRCPTQENLNKMAAILNAEEDEQVGAFVYSHLTNLKETSDPHKHDVADSINNLALDKEFDISPHKFSRNFEVSALLNKINTGVTAESNLIWSNKVQLPRAVSANLTVQLFGQSINLLDFGGRLEGLEYLVKTVFGSYVNANEKSKLDADSVKGSFYGRLFGNEMVFMHSQTAKSLFGDKTPNYLDLLIKMANNQHVALTQSVQFMDICMVIPSSAGLPIHMTVNGTATVDINMSGKMDLRKVGASPRSMDVDGEIRPSAALEVTGSMYVDSFVTKTGMRMRNTMHTSTSLKGRIQMNRGQHVNVELDTPENKMEVFNARSNFVLLHDDMEQEQEMIKENRKEFKMCSSKQMTQITGMEVCGELSFANASLKADSPYFPLTGPTAVSVTLFKRDSHTGYKLFAKSFMNRKASLAQISFNTPRSRVNRAMSVDMSLNYKKQDIEMSLVTPWKKLAVNGNLVNLKDMKGLKGSVVIDDEITYALSGETKVYQSKTKIQINPVIELKRPGAADIQVTGSMAMEKPFKSVKMEMFLSGINELVYTLKSSVTNNKKEKSLTTSFSMDGKTEYSLTASNKMSVMGKKSVIAVAQSLFEVKSPMRTLVTISNDIDYRQDKSLTLTTSMYMYRVLKKPATLKVNLLKSARTKSTNYKAAMTLKSSFASGSFVCNVNKKPRAGTLSVTSKVDYTVPKVAKNTINLSGKINDRSTKAYTSYIVQSTIGIKKNPELNSNTKIEIGHKKKLLYVIADAKYGANFKDNTKRVYLLTTINKKITSLKQALINYKVKAEAPAHNIDILLQGKHEHKPHLLDTSVTLTYAPKKDISAGVTLRNKGTKLAKVTGKAVVSWPGKEYMINTDLTQKNAKQYSHVLNFKSNSGTKHTISTVYKMPKSDAHDVVANFRLHKMIPVTISGSTNLNMKNFAASGEVKTGKDVYGFNTATKISKAPSAKMSLELIHPSRRVTLDVSGGKGRGKYVGQVETAWDADNNKDQKMSLEGAYFHKTAKGSVSMGGNVNFKSPFAMFENLAGSMKYGMDKSKHAINSNIMWGDKSEQIVSTMTMERPINLNNLRFNGDIKTPFKGFRNAEIDIAHKVDSDMSTVISGKLEKESAKVSIQGQKLSNGYKGSMNLKSTIKNAESVSVSASHTDNDVSCNNIAELNHNGKVYAYDLTMSHSGDGWQRETTGDLVLTMSKQKYATHWDHKNTDSTVKSSLSSEWKNNRLAVDLIGSHQLSNLRNINGVLKIKSPWKPVRDIEFNVDHKHGSGLIDSVVFLKQVPNKMASSIINYKSGKSTHDFEFTVASPLHEDKSGKFGINYDHYPVTTSAELSWAPKMKGTLEGSLDLASWTNADLNMKMTTPSRTIRNVVLKASNKKENSEIVSHLNLNYGMRHNIDMESRITNANENKIIRLKLTTPFQQLKSLNTGLNFNGIASKFDTTADIELLPSIGKFNGAINWQYADALIGKIRLDTPFPEYPYFELSTSSNMDGASRKSHIQAEYHPRQVFSLDSTYSFGSPLSFNAVIRSPYKQFDDVGISFQHDMGDSSVKCHGEVKYQSDKQIEADLIADWTSAIEGELIVKTPFQGHENNRISMKHRGDINSFDSHGEISVAEQNVVADASFKSGYTTTGTFTFSSPIRGAESISLSLKKKGNMNNLKGSATIVINGDRVQTTFNNKLIKDSLKTSFNLMTPYTEAFKFAVDHSGPYDSFSNKININYGRQVDIDTIASFVIHDNDVNGNAILKYKYTKGRSTGRVSFSKIGPIEDVSFSTSANFNRDEISVSGSMKIKNGIDGTVQITTPFKNFKNTGLTVSHSSDITGFTSNANINYMDKKNINGNVEFSNENGIKLSSELTTPFKNFETSSIKVNHDINNFSGDISGTAVLITPIGGFGTGDVSYSKTGNLNDLVLKGSVSSNGQDMAVFKLTNNMQNTEMNSMCSLKSVATPDMYFSIDHSGDRFSFNTKTMSKIGKNIVSTDANMKRGYDSITADSSVTYKLQGQKKNTASVSVQKNGPLDNCNIVLAGKFNNEEMKLSASRSGALNDMHFSGSAGYNKQSIDVAGAWENTENIAGAIKVLTPFENFNEVGLTVSHSGSLSDFSSNLNINYMDNQNINGYIEFSNLNGIRMSSELTTPFKNFEASSIKVNHGMDSYSGDSSGTAIVTSTIGSFGTGDISYSKTGNLKDLVLKGSVSYDEQELADLKLTNKMQNTEMNSMCSLKSVATPDMYFSIDHSGDIFSFDTNTMAKVGKNMVSTFANMKKTSLSINADSSISYKFQGQSKNTVSVHLKKKGPLDNCNMELAGKFNDDEIKLSASRSGALSDMHFSGSIGCNRQSIDITGAWKNTQSIAGTLKVQTPFDDFNNVGMMVSQSGDMSDFISNLNINYMDNKNINGKIEFSNSNGIRLSSELTTPFKNFETSSIRVNHGINDFSRDVSGNAILTTPICDFGTGDISYSKTGNLKDLVLKGSVTYNGQNLADLKLTNSMRDTERHSMCSMKSVATPDMYFSIDRSGDRFSFNTKTMSKIGKNVVSTDANMKRGYDSITVDSSITYKLQGEKKNTASVSLQKKGPLDNCNIVLAGKFNNDEVKLSASRSGALNDMHFSGSAGYNKQSIDITGTWKNTGNIVGTVKVLTPFKNFNEIGMVVSHSGDLSDFNTNFNMNYKDGKNINGKVEMTAHSLSNVKFASEFTTPFENFETLNMKFNNEYNLYTSELNGHASIDTTIVGFGTGHIAYMKTGSLDNLEITGNVLRAGVQIAALTIKNVLHDQELHSSFEYKSAVTPRVLLTLDHKGDLASMKTSAKAAVGKRNIITAEGTLYQRSMSFGAEGKVVYAIDNFGSNQFSLTLRKEGHLNNFNFEIIGKNGQQTSKVFGNFKNVDELIGALTVNTPIEGYNNVGVSFKHSGSIDSFNCEGKMVLIDGEEFSGKVDFSHHLLRRVVAVLELNTPITGMETTKFEYKHEGESNSATCSSTLQYGSSQKITYDMSATYSPKPKITLLLQMPGERFMASGSYENVWPRCSISGKLDAGEGKVISLDASFDAASDIVGTLVLSTPIEDFTNVGFTFHHIRTSKGFNAEGTVVYIDGQTVSGKAEVSMGKSGSDTTFEITTPFSGYEFTRLETKHVANKRIMKVISKLIYGNNQRITVNTYGKFKPTPEFSFTLTNPLTQNIEAFVSFDNSWPKYQLTCSMSPGNGDRYTFDSSFDATNDISGSLKIGTPFDNYNNIGMSFMHSGDIEKFGTEGTVNYMDGQEIFGKVNFYRYMWRRVDTSFELNTPFIGMKTTKAELNFEDNSNSISTTVALEYNNAQKWNSNVKLTYSPSYDVIVTVNTPSDTIKAQGALDLSSPNYQALCSLTHGHTSYSANGKLTFNSGHNLDGSFEVSTPFSGLEYTKAEYQHKLSTSELDGSISLLYDDGKKVSCDVKSTLSPNFDSTITVKTPFRGFESMQVSNAFESSYKKYQTSSSLTFGQDSIFSMASELDYSIEPMKASTKISTPFKTFQNIEIDMTHEGGLANFQTTGHLSSPMTDRVNAKASLRYDAMMDMSAAASLQSSLEGFDDLKAELKTSDVAGEMKTNAVFGWTSGQQVTFDTMFRKQEGWNEDKVHVDVSLSSPFVAVSGLNLQIDQSAGKDRYNHKMNFELNGDSLLDFDAEYKNEDKDTVELIVRQPWPMHYTASKTSTDGTTETDIFANWNRDETDSNARIQTKLTDTSSSYQLENALDLCVTYASRKVGIVNYLSNNPSELLGNGYVYWNAGDDNKVSYDVVINENARRGKQILDGSFKLGLPSRTLGLTGSYSKTSAMVSTDAALSWDVDRDNSKQVGVKTNILLGDNLKGDITLSMPTLKKEIRVDGEVMLNNGRVILETKTDISYSKDSRKTLTLTSKLEDISSHDSHFNYSLGLGLKHPYTNVHIEMNSHVGSSDESMTFGVSTDYLTSKRQMKNLALLSEINMLKKQISLQVFNPAHSIEVVGDIVSETPYKMRLMNKVDGRETFRSDVTMDKAKKEITFNTFTDADILTFAAKYPDSSAFRVDFTRHTPDIDQQEALMAVRLNTSRLLHTRLSWRPDMAQDFNAYAWPRVMEMSESAIVGIASFNDELADELTSKYSAIANEMSQELTPFISALNDELSLVAEKMNELADGLKKMYDNNEFYVQKMGEQVLKLQAKMEDLSREYTTTYTQLISSLRENLYEMRRYNAGAHYKHFVTQTSADLVSESMNSLASLELYMAEVDQVLQEYKASILAFKQKTMDTVDYLFTQIGNIDNIDVSPYISSFALPEKSTSAIYDIPSNLNDKLNNVLDEYDATDVKEGLNEVYQQGVWAYNYWLLEENLEKHAKNILTTLKEIVVEEIKEFSEDIKDVVRSPITVWDPEHGEIQAEVPLPISLKRLDQVPDMTPLISKVETFADTYLPDENTWGNIVESVSEMFPAKATQMENNKTSDDVVEQLTKLKPTKKYRKKTGRKYKVTRSRQ